MYRFEQGTNGKTLVLFHGTGGSEHDLIPFARMIDHDANIISFRGRVNEYGMLRFFKRISPGVFDLDSLILETNFYIKSIQELSFKHHFNLEKVTLLGYSNGANIIGSILFHQTDLLSKAILIRPMIPLREPPFQDLSHLRMIVLSGKYDTIVPLQEVHDLKEMFNKRKADVTLHLLECGHGLIPEEVSIIKHWYEQ
ncbi:MAG: alpha/beta hydrolase [Acholeplasma sp.]|jgi:phospholipase/carboxylesterase|nr:MAG: alpha/beta hydrolase [Acholeplasma sp.]